MAKTKKTTKTDEFGTRTTKVRRSGAKKIKTKSPLGSLKSKRVISASGRTKKYKATSVAKSDREIERTKTTSRKHKSTTRFKEDAYGDFKKGSRIKRKEIPSRKGKATLTKNKKTHKSGPVKKSVLKGRVGSVKSYRKTTRR
tara:strand:+ start:2074 stop:2499 length:426 start_codon:yes stop_codon:yes gene_type:complete